jgi:hypothetical protein
VNYFFSTSPAQPNSLWLVIVGGAGLLFAAFRFWRRQRCSSDSRLPLPPTVPVVALFALTIAGNLGLLMFYYWSRLDQPIATRFALPACFALSLVAGWFVHSLDLRWARATRIAAFGLATWLLVFAAPAYAHRLYTTHNQVMHEVNWEVEQAMARRRPILFITSKATMPFLLEKIPALNITIAAIRGPQIAWHLREQTFKEILVAQVMRPTSAEGEAIVDPDDMLPSNFHLHTLTEKRFGGRWIRISRLEGVAGVDATSPTSRASEPAK